jgi:hypothetical protein
MTHELPLGHVEIPEAWEDRSSYQFVSPPIKGLDVPLASGGGSNVQQTRASIVIATTTSAGDIASTCKKQLAELRSSLPGFKLVSDAAWQHPQLGTVPAIDFNFELGPGQVVRQVQVFVPGRAGAVVVLTFSAASGQFSSQKKSFEQVLGSFCAD